MDKSKYADTRSRIEDQDWWKKYSAMLQEHRSQLGSMLVSSGSSYMGSGSGSGYIGSGSGSLGIRYVGSGSGSLGIRYVGSGSGSLGIRYVGSGSGSLGIRYIGSGSGSLGIRYIGSGSEDAGVRYTGSGVASEEVADSNAEEKVEETVIDVTNLSKKESNTVKDPYAVYPRSRFPGEGSGSDNGNGILAYGLGLI